MPAWHHGKEYGKIEEYVRREAKAFLELYSWLLAEMPKFLERYRKEKTG